jgi:hypothetical protein
MAHLSVGGRLRQWRRLLLLLRLLERLVGLERTSQPLRLSPDRLALLPGPEDGDAVRALEPHSDTHASASWVARWEGVGG